MVGKRNLSGPKSAPEMPVRIFKTAHGAYKPVLVQTPSLSFPLSPHISVSKFSGCFPTDIEVSEQDDYLKEELKQQEAWTGAWC